MNLFYLGLTVADRTDQLLSFFYIYFFSYLLIFFYFPFLIFFF